METKHIRSIFVNLPVRDLKAAQAFFGSLGFEFNPKYTDDNAACMIVSELAYVMLLAEPFFTNFTTQQRCDTTTATEVLVAYSVGSRAEVDEVVGKAVAMGGAEAGPPQDHGFMYQRSFYDLDRHHWEVLWIDPATA